MPPSRSSLLPGAAGAATAAAGLVHAAAAGTHDGDGALAVLFAVTALVQVVLGVGLAARPGRPALLATTGVNLVAAGTWAASRLSGLPLLDGLADPQPVGLQDGMATLLEGVAAGAALLALRHREPFVPRPLSPVLALALVPALVGMTATHSHPEGGHHEDAAQSLSAASHPGGGHAEEGARSLPGDPIFSGADTSHADEAELEAARALILATREAVLAAFPDEASVVRAGYRSIGDGRVPGTFEHFVHLGYLVDGRELDPQRVESIVLENTGAGKRVASAMYILELGRTMEDVPDVAGELTAWHDHQNLCWDESGIRLAGILVDGRCVPRGIFRPTPPMLHVWLQDHPCGPFAGIEGHGAGCGHHAD